MIIISAFTQKNHSSSTMSTDRAASGSSAPKEEKADDAELENLKEPAETSLSIKSGSIQRLSVNVGKKWKPHGRGSTSVTGSHHSTNLIPVLEDENDEDYDFAVQYLQRRKTMNVLKYEDPEEELQSAMQKRKGHTKRWINTWVWMIRIGPLVAALALIGYFFMLVANPDNWESGVVEQDGDNEEDGDAVLKRTVNRGMVMSIIVSFVITFMGGYMFHVGVPEGMVITNFGFVLAPVIGYMFDVGIATDEGWRLFMTWDGITFAFASLISGNFVRYVVTFFLDLFISNPLQDILKRQARAGGIMESLKENDATNKWIRAWDHKLVEKFSTFLNFIHSSSFLQTVCIYKQFSGHSASNCGLHNIQRVYEPDAICMGIPETERATREEDNSWRHYAFYSHRGYFVPQFLLLNGYHE